MGSLLSLLLASGLPAAPIPGTGPAVPMAPAPCADPASLNPMARDMLDRMLQAARAEPDPAKRRMVLDGVAEGIPRALYGTLLEALAPPAPESTEYAAARAIFLRWAWDTPDYAAAWASTSPPGPFRMEALVESVARWATRHPADAARWSRALPLADRRWVLENAGHLIGRASPASVEAWERAVASQP